jgi:hypothetical protein
LLYIKNGKRDPEFLTFVLCYYFFNYVFSGGRNFDTDFMQDWIEREEYITLDLSPFFIYQEQVNSVVEDLSGDYF